METGPQDSYKVSVVYNSYYQWVPLYLTFLAFFFYLPRYIWLKMEGGLMKLFRKGTTARFKNSTLFQSVIFEKFFRFIEDQDEKREKLVQFFCRNIHNKYDANIQLSPRIHIVYNWIQLILTLY